MRKKRRLWRALAALVCLGAVMFVALVGTVCYCAGMEREVSSSDCIIVLGARVRPDGTLSDSLRYRCEAALAAWREGLAPALIVCGAQGKDEPMPEAVAMRDWLAAQGVPQEAIVLEDASFNTEQNLEKRPGADGRTRLDKRHRRHQRLPLAARPVARARRGHRGERHRRRIAAHLGHVAERPPARGVQLGRIRAEQSITQDRRRPDGERFSAGPLSAHITGGWTGPPRPDTWKGNRRSGRDRPRPASRKPGPPPPVRPSSGEWGNRRRRRRTRAGSRPQASTPSPRELGDGARGQGAAFHQAARSCTCAVIQFWLLTRGARGRVLEQHVAGRSTRWRRRP